MTNTLTISYDPDTARLTRAFETSDPIGATIRVHAEVDAAVDHVLNTFSGWVNETRPLPRQFGAKLDRLSEYGFPAVRLSPLRELNAIRIEVAHCKREVPTDGQIAQLRRAIERAVGRDLGDFKLTLCKSSEGKTVTRHFGDMTNAEKFVFLGMALSMVVAALPDEVRAELSPFVRLQ